MLPSPAFFFAAPAVSPCPCHAPPHRRPPVTLLAPTLAAFAAAPSAWIDFNNNGQKAPSEDGAQPIERRIDDLLAQMTVDEKTCQLATL